MSKENREIEKLFLELGKSDIFNFLAISKKSHVNKINHKVRNIAQTAAFSTKRGTLLDEGKKMKLKDLEDYQKVGLLSSYGIVQMVFKSFMDLCIELKTTESNLSFDHSSDIRTRKIENLPTVVVSEMIVFYTFLFTRSMILSKSKISINKKYHSNKIFLEIMTGSIEYLETLFMILHEWAEEKEQSGLVKLFKKKRGNTREKPENTFSNFLRLYELREKRYEKILLRDLKNQTDKNSSSTFYDFMETGIKQTGDNLPDDYIIMLSNHLGFSTSRIGKEMDTITHNQVHEGPTPATKIVELNLLKIYLTKTFAVQTEAIREKILKLEEMMEKQG